jgi:hypothetical protein
MLAIRAYLLVDLQVNAEATPEPFPPAHGTRPARIDNACIGTVCGGTLYSSWVDIGRFDFETFELVAREKRHFTGGTGPFAHTNGSLQGTFDAVTGVWTYSGQVGF